MDLQLTQEQRMIRDSARDFAREEILPVAAASSQAGSDHKERRDENGVTLQQHAAPWSAFRRCVEGAEPDLLSCSWEKII